MSKTGQLDNPYLDEYRDSDRSDLDQWEQLKERLLRKYAYAIPTEKVISKLASLAPLVEIGAGLGYWAWLLDQVGAAVLAFDQPYDREHYFPEPETIWHPVLDGDPGKAADHADRTLFLCWPDGPPDPSNQTGFASECLQKYGGDTVAYVGFPRGGITAEDTFFDLLECSFQLSETIRLEHSWGPRKDEQEEALFIYHRRSR